MGEVTLDLDKMLGAKVNAVDTLTGGIEYLFKKNSTFLAGSACPSSLGQGAIHRDAAASHTVLLCADALGFLCVRCMQTLTTSRATEPSLAQTLCRLLAKVETST